MLVFKHRHARGQFKNWAKLLTVQQTPVSVTAVLTAVSKSWCSSSLSYSRQTKLMGQLWCVVPSHHSAVLASPSFWPDHQIPWLEHKTLVICIAFTFVAGLGVPKGDIGVFGNQKVILFYPFLLLIEKYSIEDAFSFFSFFFFFLIMFFAIGEIQRKEIAFGTRNTRCCILFHKEYILLCAKPIYKRDLCNSRF